MASDANVGTSNKSIGVVLDLCESEWPLSDGNMKAALAALRELPDVGLVARGQVTLFFADKAADGSPQQRQFLELFFQLPTNIQTETLQQTPLRPTLASMIEQRQKAVVPAVA